MADNNKPTLPSNAGKESGVSGIIDFNGYITGEDYNYDLSGVRGNRIYEIMRRSDSTVHSALQIVKLPILSTTWSIEPFKQPDGTVTPEDQERADFLNRELFDRNINFNHFVKEALTCYDFGFSLFEKVFEITEFNGKVRIGLNKLAFRKQFTIFAWQTEDGKPGVTQITPTGTFNIPDEKVLDFAYDREGDNREGTSLLRFVYKDWDIKDKLTLVNAMALEKQGMGVPITQARDGMTPSETDKKKAMEALANMRANEQSHLEIPDTMTIEMLDMKGSTTKDIIPTLEYHDGRIMTGVLARFMELGGKGSGSQALARELSSIFMKAEEGMADEIVATLMEKLVKQLIDLNYSDVNGQYPQLTYGAIADDDTTALADSVSKLMTAGALTKDVELENDIRERLRLPEMSKDAVDNYGKTDIVSADPTIKDKTGKTAKVADKAAVDKGVETLKKGGDVSAAIKAARDIRQELYLRLQED